MTAPPAGPALLARQLEETGYLPDEGLATAAFLAGAMGRPLLLEGEAGVGKTALAQALAQVRGVPLIRLQCYEGIDAAQALYDWDFPRQILHLRALEATVTTGGVPGPTAVQDVEDQLYTERFLLARPILQAIRTPGSVLLVDEIDRADDEFEALLLEVLSENAVTVPELGRIAASTPPLVVLTSNRTREVHDALKRRCLYHWVEHPDLAREVAILRRRLPEVATGLVQQIARATSALRHAELIKPPGVAEALDWARALHTLGCTTLDPQVAASTLGAVLKYREDIDRVTAAGLADLLAS
jgi:MoxR-like ATPase